MGLGVPIALLIIILLLLLLFLLQVLLLLLLSLLLILLLLLWLSLLALSGERVAAEFPAGRPKDLQLHLHGGQMEPETTTYTCVHIYIYIYFIYLNMYIYIYIHVCVYTLYIYIYIHVYIWPLSRVLITNSPTTRSDKPSTFKTTHWASPLWQCIVWTVTGCSETMVGEIAFKSPYLKHPDHRRALNTYYLLKVRLICCALSLANASSVYRIIDYICQMFVKCVNICQTFEIYA